MGTSEFVLWPALIDKVFFYYGEFFWMFCERGPASVRACALWDECSPFPRVGV